MNYIMEARENTKLSTSQCQAIIKVLGKKERDKVYVVRNDIEKAFHSLSHSFSLLCLKKLWIWK